MRDLTIQKFDGVRTRLKNGETLKDALKAEKLSPSYYYKNKNKAARAGKHMVKKSKPEFIDVAHAHHQRNDDWVVICSAASLKKVIAGLA